MSQLGEPYERASKKAAEMLEGFEPEMFSSIIDDAVKEFQNKLWDSVKDWLIDDTENNVQSHIWQTAERTIEAILGGNEWAIKRYVMGSNIAHEEIREALAEKLAPELIPARMADQQSKIEELRKSLEHARRYQ